MGENMIIFRKTAKILVVFVAIIFTISSINFFAFIINRYLYPLKYKEIVIENADLYGLDRALVFATIKVESSFDKNAQSNKGAVGLMQITLSTAEYIANRLNINEYDLQDENINVRFGCYYLRYLIDKFKNIETAICAYNAGEGNVSKWLKDSDYSEDQITLKTVPFKETEEYLKKIVKTFEKYKKLYGNLLDKR